MIAMDTRDSLVGVDSLKSREASCPRKKRNHFTVKIVIQNPICILGLEFTCPNAEEFTLKLQETCLILSQGMSISDSLHGPTTSLSEKSQVIFTSPLHLP